MLKRKTSEIITEEENNDQEVTHLTASHTCGFAGDVITVSFMTVSSRSSSVVFSLIVSEHNL